MVQIDPNLNLVIPIDRPEGSVRVFSTPIADAVFERFWLIISKTFTQVYKEDLSLIGGPRVVSLMLREIAQATPRGASGQSWWEGPDGVEMGLVGEIRRRTTVFAPGANGWVQLLLDDAIKAQVLTAREAQEVEGALVFFTVNWHMHRCQVAIPVLEAAGRLWGWGLSPLVLTDFRASLTTSTTDAASTSGQVRPASSIPS